MKKKTYLFSIGCVMGLLFSVYTQAEVYIQFNIKNVPPGSKITIYYGENDIENNEITPVDDTLSNDILTVRFPIQKATVVACRVRDYSFSIFLSPNDSLIVTADYSFLEESLRYNGRGAAENNILAAYNVSGYQAANTYMSFNDAKVFERFIDSLEQQSNVFYQANDNHTLSPAFRAYFKGMVKYQFYHYRWMYQIGFNSQKQSFYIKETPDDYFNFLNNIDLNDTTVKVNGYYDIAISHYIQPKPKVEKTYSDSTSAIEGKTAEFQQAYDLRKKLFKHKILDFQLSSFVYQNLKNVIENEPFVLAILKDYESVCQNTAYKQSVMQVYLKEKSLGKNQKAPNFQLKQFNGNPIALSDFKGKVVFIDIWATWCVPCMVALPKTMEMEQKFKSYPNVVFLYINYNDEYSRWTAHLNKKPTTTIQLYADKTQSENLRNGYKIYGIPRYVLINKEGNFIAAYTEVSEKTEALILEALKE